MQLTATEKDTVAVLKYVLNPNRLSVPKITSSWSEIKNELKIQAVACLPTGNINVFNLSEEEKRENNLSISKSISQFYRILSEQDALAKIFGEIKYVILKGTAAAIYYPRPELRQMGDIDVLVREEDFDKAVGALELAEYRKKNENENTRHEIYISKYNTIIELHRWFSTSENEEQNRYLDKKIYEGILEREYYDIHGHKVPILPKLENGLVLLSHISEHLSNGLGMRQIVDWMMYVRENLDDDFWREVFCESAEAIGMRYLAEVTTLMCKKYLGLEGVSWCDGVDNKITENLLEYIINKGNFGQKGEEKSKATVSVMRSISKPKNTFAYLHENGMRNWNAVQKHRILRPFAWIYQLFRIIVKGIKRKVKLSQFIKEAKQSRDENELMEKLNVTRK